MGVWPMSKVTDSTSIGRTPRMAEAQAAGPKDGIRGIHICVDLNWSVQLIGLRENLQEHPIFHGKIYGFL